MLWKEAIALQNFKFAKTLLENTDPSAAKTASAVLQGGLVKLWRETADKYVKKSKWIKDHFKKNAPDIELVRANLQTWLRERDDHGVLEFKGIWDDTDHGTGEWLKYSFTNASYTAPFSHYVYHGTWAYGVRSILSCQAIAPSVDEDLGHEFRHPGTLCCLAFW